MVGIKKEWREGKWENVDTGRENILHVRVTEEEENLNIILVYNDRKKGEKLRKIITKILERIKNGKVIVGEDFNIRIGELGGEEFKRGIARKSKNKTIGNGGKRFVEKMEKKGLNILNGKTKENWEDKYTYVGARGCMVIDFIFANELGIEKCAKFVVISRVDSDYMPICIEIWEEKEEDKDRRRKEKKETTEEQEEKRIISWDEEAIERYRKLTEEIGWVGDTDNGEINVEKVTKITK